MTHLPSRRAVLLFLFGFSLWSCCLFLAFIFHLLHTVYTTPSPTKQSITLSRQSPTSPTGDSGVLEGLTYMRRGCDVIREAREVFAIVALRLPTTQRNMDNPVFNVRVAVENMVNATSDECTWVPLLDGSRMLAVDFAYRTVARGGGFVAAFKVMLSIPPLSLFAAVMRRLSRYWRWWWWKGWGWGKGMSLMDYDEDGNDSRYDDDNTHTNDDRDKFAKVRAMFSSLTATTLAEASTGIEGSKRDNMGKAQLAVTTADCTQLRVRVVVDSREHNVVHVAHATILLDARRNWIVSRTLRKVGLFRLLMEATILMVVFGVGAVMAIVVFALVCVVGIQLYHLAVASLCESLRGEEREDG